MQGLIERYKSSNTDTEAQRESSEQNQPQVSIDHMIYLAISNSIALQSYA